MGGTGGEQKAGLKQRAHREKEKKLISALSFMIKWGEVELPAQEKVGMSRWGTLINPMEAFVRSKSAWKL